jgi:hypothetical protein
VVERSIRPIALNRKNALFAGSDQGGVDYGVIPMICFCIRSPRVKAKRSTQVLCFCSWSAWMPPA